VLVRRAVNVSFSESEVNHKDSFIVFASPQHEIVGLDVSVEELCLVDRFDPVDDLDCNHADCFEAHFTLTLLQQ
jgi:hypothetical protein